MRGIGIEQPPFDENIELQEWLARVMAQITMEFEKGVDMEPVGQLPTKIQDGMVRFFKIPIAPDILHAGPWIVINGAWVSMV